MEPYGAAQWEEISLSLVRFPMPLLNTIAKNILKMTLLSKTDINNYVT